MSDRALNIRGRIRAASLTPEQFDQPVLKRLHSYWAGVRGMNRWVRHAGLRPEEFAFAMPYIALIDRPPVDGPGMRIRLVGEEIRNEGVGYIRGALIEHIEPVWYREHLITRYGAVFETGEPTFEAVHVFYDVRNFYYHRLILPLTVDGDRADIIMVATIYSAPHARFHEPEEHLA